MSIRKSYPIFAACCVTSVTKKEDLSQIPNLLAETERGVLKALESMDFSALAQSIQELTPNAQSLGIAPQNGFRAGMDPLRVSFQKGAIALFDGPLPLSSRGRGSRRLLAMAIHKSSIKEGAIILVDEIENSLEPYRLRHLIRQLRPTENEKHQVIFTSHSDLVVVECQSKELYVTNSNCGETTIACVGEELQGIVRSIPEAFLCKKIIVCEGKTEAGVLLSLDKSYWKEEHLKTNSQAIYLTMAEAGTTPIASPKAGGSEAPKYACALAKLNYQVAYFGDSDRDLNPSEEQMKLSGVEEVLLWEGSVEIERRLCFDLPLPALEEFTNLAIKINGNSQSIWDKIFSILPNADSIEQTNDVNQLLGQIGETTLRECLGKAADEGCWFKRIDKGEELGKLLAKHLNNMHNTPTMATLKSIEKWCYE